MYNLAQITKTMSESEFILACIKNDKVAKRQFFDSYYPSLSFISLRYSKNKEQSELATQKALQFVLTKLNSFKSQTKYNLTDFIKHTFITYLVDYIKNIRNEYYVASTVKAQENMNHSYDLFLDSQLIDVRTANQPTVLKSIQELVPSQRIIINMHIIDGYNLSEMSDLLETSEQTIKSNLEKGRFNLQKNIEKNLKLANYEQSI